MTDQERLLEALEALKEDCISGIQESIRIDSVGGDPEPGAPFGPGPKKALDWALELGEKLGLQCKNVDDHAGWVEFGEGEEMVAAVGHLDVVPAGDGWTYPAFGAEIHDGVLYGRGVLDDKGPTIGCFYVLKAMKDAGIPLKRRVRVIFGTDEERGSACMKYYANSEEEKPVLGFTPDADYPLIFFEKGCSPCLVGKKSPQQGEIKILECRGGEADNIVPKFCELLLEGEHVVGEYPNVHTVIEDGKTRITATGKNAHGSTPELGENAIMILMHAIRDLEIGGDFARLRDFLLENVKMETNGESMGILYQDEETGETTVNVGLLAYSDKEMSVSFDIRYPKKADPDAVRSAIEERVAASSLELLKINEVPMLYVPKDSDLVQILLKVYREATGDKDAEPLAIGGGTYAKTLPNMVAFGPIFPGTPDCIHQKDERWDLEQMWLSLRINAVALMELANS